MFDVFLGIFINFTVMHMQFTELFNYSELFSFKKKTILINLLFFTDF